MLSAVNICKSFAGENAGSQVLKNVSLDIAPGDFLCITGRSGSGKSTLLNVLATLLSPDAGQVLLDGREIDFGSERTINHVRRTVFSMIFQMHHLMPYLTALENVLLPFMGKVRPVTREEAVRARECLERVGLGGKADRLPGRLSGGEQQRVAIARALVKGPRVLFADEPTGSLDRATGEGIIQTLKGLNDAGLTIVMVTHEPDYARVGTGIAVMDDGVIRMQ